MDLKEIREIDYRVDPFKIAKILNNVVDYFFEIIVYCEFICLWTKKIPFPLIYYNRVILFLLVQHQRHHQHQ